MLTKARKVLTTTRVKLLSSWYVIMLSLIVLPMLLSTWRVWWVRLLMPNKATKGTQKISTTVEQYCFLCLFRGNLASGGWPQTLSAPHQYPAALLSKWTAHQVAASPLLSAAFLSEAATFRPHKQAPPISCSAHLTMQKRHRLGFVFFKLCMFWSVAIRSYFFMVVYVWVW